LRIVPSSTIACHIGSQCASWKLGSPSAAGFSVNVTEWQPFAATRLISCAHNSGSHSTGNAIGMKRPGYEPHHSSMCQSLYACTISSAMSLSSAVANNRPENDGNDGKFIVASTPPALMSFTRSWTS
jgi:hypothetical protein